MIPPSCRRHEYQYLWHASVSERSISRARAEHYGYRVSGCVSAAAPVSGIAAKRSTMTKSRRLLRFVAPIVPTATEQHKSRYVRLVKADPGETVFVSKRRWQMLEPSQKNPTRSARSH